MKFFLASFLVMLTIMVRAQKPVESKPEIKSVTVYLQGAELNLKATANVPSGTNDIVFTNLPQNINASTIQVSASSDLVIMSAVFQLNYLNTEENNPRAKTLRDSLDLLNKQLEKVRDQKAVVKGQMDLLNSNKTVAGQNTGLNMDQLKAMYDFYFSKMTELNNSQFEFEQQENKLTDNITRIQNQLNQLAQTFNQPSGEIAVKVNTKSAGASTFNISFIVPDAGWYPEYDIRSKDVKSNVTLNYKAQVYQNTGMDWNDVKLKLSTGNPTVSATGPILDPWYLDFYAPVVYGEIMEDQLKSYNNMTMPSAVAGTRDESGKDKNEQTLSTTTANYTTVTQSQLMAEFDIALQYDVPSDGKAHLISIQDYTLPAAYHYYAVPKLDPDAFLTADVTNWGELNLLPGIANIFFEGTYVGQSQLNPSVTKDTLSISLGRDKSIIVKREQVKDFSKVHDIGDNRKQSFAYTISVRNTKSEPIDIKIMDQFPISNNSQIEVTQDDAGGATVNLLNSKLAWSLHMNANEEKKLQFSFTVKYPKDQELPGL